MECLPEVGSLERAERPESPRPGIFEPTSPRCPARCNRNGALWDRGGLSLDEGSDP
jgi:hypothetical protein